MKTMHKKKFLLALSAFLAVGVMSVSCLTQGFEGPEHEIGVRPVSGLATKASSNGPINVNTFDQGRTIFLSAYFHDANGTNHSQVYFTDIPFTYYSSKWAGGTSGTPNPKYWPHQGTMDFIALSKEGLSGTVTTTPSSQIVYVMPDNSSNQDDVMMAYAGAQNCAAHEAVPLAFKHAQAQVSVKAKLAAAAYSSNYGITIRSVALRRAKYSGTVTGTASGTNNVTFSWSNVGSSNAGVGFGNALLALSTTEQSYGKGILVPAQSPTGVDGDIDIIIEYTLKNGLPATGSTPEERNLSYVYTVPATNWTAGNKYTYVFSFSWNEITCEPTVSEWGDGGTTNEPDTRAVPNFNIQAMGMGNIGPGGMMSQSYMFNVILTGSPQPTGNMVVYYQHQGRSQEGPYTCSRLTMSSSTQYSYNVTSPNNYTGTTTVWFEFAGDANYKPWSSSTSVYF